MQTLPTKETLPLLASIVGNGAVLEERGEDGDDVLLVLLHRYAFINKKSHLQRYTESATNRSIAPCRTASFLLIFSPDAQELCNV